MAVANLKHARKCYWMIRQVAFVFV